MRDACRGIDAVIHLAGISHEADWPELLQANIDGTYCVLPRPDTLYGVSKAVNEALGSLYHDRYGMDVLCARIGSCTARPQDRRS